MVAKIKSTLVIDRAILDISLFLMLNNIERNNKIVDNIIILISGIVFVFFTKRKPIKNVIGKYIKLKLFGKKFKYVVKNGNM